MHMSLSETGMTLLLNNKKKIRGNAQQAGSTTASHQYKADAVVDDWQEHMGAHEAGELFGDRHGTLKAHHHCVQLSKLAGHS